MGKTCPNVTCLPQPWSSPSHCFQVHGGAWSHHQVYPASSLTCGLCVLGWSGRQMKGGGRDAKFPLLGHVVTCCHPLPLPPLLNLPSFLAGAHSPPLPLMALQRGTMAASSSASAPCCLCAKIPALALDAALGCHADKVHGWVGNCIWGWDCGVMQTWGGAELQSNPWIPLPTECISAHPVPEYHCPGPHPT